MVHDDIFHMDEEFNGTFAMNFRGFACRFQGIGSLLGIINIGFLS